VSGRQLYWKRAILFGLNVGVPAVTIAAGFPWALMWTAFAAHAALVYAVTAPGCGWLGPVVTRFRTDKREAWLTIDDGPDGASTVALAGELRRRGVRATFFVKGCNLDRYPEAAAAVLAAGHSLANHTATHPTLTFGLLLPSRLRAEIDGCALSLRQAGAADGAGWFRAPMGIKHLFLHSQLQRRGMRLMAWNVRGRDGLRCDPARVTRRVVRRAAPGCIILLHEGRPRSNEAILRVIDTLLAEGYSFVIPPEETLA
jgi:peptidoglycan/xylan/chitin deacetylase (PgdA/CDA1 family)